MPTICLTFFINNDEKEIPTFLDKVSPHIDYWICIDGFSSDNGVQVIENYFQAKAIPGEIHQEEKRGELYIRTKQKDHCKGKGDYVMYLDVEDLVEFVPDWKIQLTDHDYYDIRDGMMSPVWTRFLVRNELDYKWKGLQWCYTDPRGTTKNLEGIYKWNERGEELTRQWNKAATEMYNVLFGT